jgi:hypothetical protein
MPYEGFREMFERELHGWDPDAWAEQFRRSGARYVVMVTKHHDGYSMWPTATPHPHRPNWHCERDLLDELDRLDGQEDHEVAADARDFRRDHENLDQPKATLHRVGQTGYGPTCRLHHPRVHPVRDHRGQGNIPREQRRRLEAFGH